MCLTLALFVVIAAMVVVVNVPLLQPFVKGGLLHEVVAKRSRVVVCLYSRPMLPSSLLQCLHSIHATQWCTLGYPSTAQ